MALTPYTPTTWVNDSEPDLEADNLNKIEQGIQEAIDGVNGILNALSSQIEDNTAKFASSAALYAVNNSLNTVSTNLATLQGTVSTLNSNLALKANASDIALLTATNLNTATSSRFYYVTSATVGIPVTGLYGQMLYLGVLGYTPGTAGYATQCIWGNDGHVYWRFAMNEASWSSWKRLDSAI